MAQRTIQVSDTVYHLLSRRAAWEKQTVEQVADQLLMQELELVTNQDPSAPPISASADVSTALAAVYRLTTLFADVEIAQLEQVLADPMIELVNVDIDWAQNR